MIIKITDEQMKGLSLQSLGFLLFLKKHEQYKGQEIQLTNADFETELGLSAFVKKKIMKELLKKKLISYRIAGYPTRQCFKLFI